MFFQADVNVILLDWARGAAAERYMKGVANAELISKMLALLIKIMVTEGASPKDFHLIGSSLGAHLAGFTGQTLKGLGLTVGQITGK